jgi:hypothetical protein
MKTHDSFLSSLIASVACAVCGCASVAQGDIEKQAAEIRVYKLAELSGTPYESVGHIWVDSWRTAFFPPAYPGEDEALRSLRAEAARLGANGLVSVVCLDQNTPTKSTNAVPAILCYANAVRVRPRQG